MPGQFSGFKIQPTWFVIEELWCIRTLSFNTFGNVLKACCYLSSSFCPTSVPVIIMLFVSEFENQSSAHDLAMGIVHILSICHMSICTRLVSAVNFSWTTLCLSTADHLFVGRTDCWRMPMSFSREVSQLDMHPPPPSSITHKHMKEKSDICTNIASHTK